MILYSDLYLEKTGERYGITASTGATRINMGEAVSSCDLDQFFTLVKYIHFINIQGPVCCNKK